MDIEVFMKAFAVAIILVAAVVLNEYLTKILEIPTFLSRKTIHLLGSIIVCVGALFIDYKLYILIAVAFIPIMLMFRSRKLKSLSDRQAKSYGEMLFPAGIGLGALLAPSQDIFIAAILVLGISDTLAFFTGKYIKSPKIIFDKTMLGSFTFFLSTFIILALFAPSIWLAIVIALLATIVELFSSRGLDNLTIPPVISLSFVLLSIGMISDFFASFSPVILTGILVMAIIKTNILKALDKPIDFNVKFFDNKPLLGESKTWRGLVLYVICGALSGMLWFLFSVAESIAQSNLFLVDHQNTFLFNTLVGTLLGVSYAIFELPNSFLKRRFGVRPSKSATQLMPKVLFFLIDQTDSLFGCLLILWLFYPALSAPQFFIFLLLGALVHIVVNLFLFILKIRKSPV